MDVDQTDYCAVALEYAEEAAADVQGRRFCKWVRLAAARHIADLARAETDAAWPFEFDDWHGNDVCGFAKRLPHVEGRWASPNIHLERAQIFWLVSLFGWRRRAGGMRRFSVAYIEVARKNAKSTLAAIVALYCLTCEQENGPQVLIAATTGEQAGKVFLPAKRMVERTTALREAFYVQAFAKSISCGSNGGFIQPINAKASTQDGWNPHCAILDELHAHKDRDLYDVVRSAFGARRNPLLLQITTAGHNHEGICYDQRTLLTKVLEGVVEADHVWGVIYTLDDGDDPFDPRVWCKANPLLGVSIQLTELEGYAIEAQNGSEAAYEFKTKRVNMWLTARGGHIRIEAWRKCDAPVDLASLRDVPCWGGLDLASTSDLTSFRLVWWLNGRLITWGLRYLPDGAIEPRTARANVPYRRWRSQAFMGRPYLTITPGDVTDYAFVERDVRWAMEEFRVQSIGFDRWNAQDLCNRLMADGAPMVEVRQGPASLSGPMKELDRVYLGGMLDHGGDEVLAWCASNVVARSDPNENLAPDKKKSAEKIDDYVALLNALAVSTRPTEGGPSRYDDPATRDLMFV